MDNEHMNNTPIQYSVMDAFFTQVTLLNQSINEKRTAINARWTYFSSSKDNQDESYQEAQNSWTTLLFFLRKLQNGVNRLEFWDNNWLISFQDSWANVESQYSEFLRLTETNDITPINLIGKSQEEIKEWIITQEVSKNTESKNRYEAIFQYLLPWNWTIPNIPTVSARIAKLLEKGDNDNTMKTDIRTVMWIAMNWFDTKRIVTDTEHAANNAAMLSLAEKNGDIFLANQIKLQFWLAEEMAANDATFGQSISKLDNQEITRWSIEFLTKEIRWFLQINKITPVFKKPWYYRWILTKRWSRWEEIQIPILIQNWSFGLHEPSKITQLNQDGSIGEVKNITILKMKFIPDEVTASEEKVAEKKWIYWSVTNSVQKITTWIRDWWKRKAI